MRTIKTGEINQKAYNRGSVSCFDADGDIFYAQNPYKKESVAWQSWNYGWNTKRENSWRKL